MDKKTSKMAQNWGVSPFATPHDFFSKIGLSLLYPYGALTSCRKLEKTNAQPLRYLKMDHGRTDQKTRAITKDPLG